MNSKTSKASPTAKPAPIVKTPQTPPVPSAAPSSPAVAMLDANILVLMSWKSHSGLESGTQELLMR